MIIGYKASGVKIWQKRPADMPAQREWNFGDHGGGEFASWRFRTCHPTDFAVASKPFAPAAILGWIGPMTTWSMWDAFQSRRLLASNAREILSMLGSIAPIHP